MRRLAKLKELKERPVVKQVLLIETWNTINYDECRITNRLCSVGCLINPILHSHVIDGGRVMYMNKHIHHEHSLHTIFMCDMNIYVHMWEFSMHNRVLMKCWSVLSFDHNMRKRILLLIFLLINYRKGFGISKMIEEIRKPTLFEHSLKDEDVLPISWLIINF